MSSSLFRKRCKNDFYFSDLVFQMQGQVQAIANPNLLRIQPYLEFPTYLQSLNHAKREEVPAAVPKACGPNQCQTPWACWTNCSVQLGPTLSPTSPQWPCWPRSSSNLPCWGRLVNTRLGGCTCVGVAWPPRRAWALSWWWRHQEGSLTCSNTVRWSPCDEQRDLCRLTRGRTSRLLSRWVDL